MNRTIRTVCALAAGAALALPAAADARGPKPVELQLLAFNDFHGHLEATTPGTVRPVDTGSSSDPSVRAGGLAYFGTHLEQQRRENRRNTLVISTGDLIGGSPLVSAVFHDEPTVEAMNLLGLDMNVVGNHEFDEGTEELDRMVRGGCHPEDGCYDGPDRDTRPDGYEGADFPFLAANVVDKDTAAPIYRPYVIERVNGIRVAFIGVVTETTPDIVAQEGIQDVEFLDEAETVNRYAEELDDRGVEAQVVLLHEGAGQGSASAERPNTPNTCNDLTGPAADITRAIDDEVDVVLSGHTHSAYVCPDFDNGKLLVSGLSFGRLITDVDLTLDRRSREISSAVAENVIVTQDVAPHPELQRLVDHYVALSAPLANRRVGEVAGALTRTQTAAGESTLGNVIADAQLAATEELGAVAAFMNPGGIRSDLDAGEVTFGEAFTVQPFSNSLVTLTLTGAQIDTLLEQQWCGQLDPTRPRILQVSEGFTYSWSASAPVCDRVDESTIEIDGVPVDPAAQYRITVNSFLADGGDRFFVLREGTDRVGGGIDLDAFEAYLGAQGGALPVPATGRITVTP